MSEKYVVVTAVSMFKMRYVVSQSELQGFNPDVPLDETTLIKWAEDSVVCEELDELSQSHLEEVIINSEILSEEQVLKIFDQENDYLSNWTKDQKIHFIQNRKREDGFNL